MSNNGKEECRPKGSIALTATQAIRWEAITTGEVLSDVGLVILCVSIPWTTSGIACRHKLVASAISSSRLL